MAHRANLISIHGRITASRNSVRADEITPIITRVQCLISVHINMHTFERHGVVKNEILIRGQS